MKQGVELDDLYIVFYALKKLLIFNSSENLWTNTEGLRQVFNILNW